ncbi:MAG TPA: hypothetical protein VNL92_08150, partial [Dehalococcoidia bacterium]|nr:hypothetical protein [Dehalococcoidia bacterium]
LVAEARPVLDHLMDVARERYELTQPRERSRAVDEILPVLAGIQDQVVLMDYLQRLATLARVELPVLSERLRAAQRKRAPRTQGEPAGQARAAIPQKKGAREEFILALLHRHPSLRARGLDLSPAMFWDSQHRALFEAWRDERDTAADEHLRAPLERILQRELPPYDAQQADEALASAIRLLERERLLEAKNAAASALAEETRRIGEETLVDSAVRVLAGRGAAQDDDLAPAVAVAIADVDAGLRLHGQAARGTNEPHEKAVGSVEDECIEMTTE